MKTLKRAFRAARLSAFALAALSSGTAHAAVTIGDQLDVRYLLPAVAHNSGVFVFAGDKETVLIQPGIGSVAEAGQIEASWQDGLTDGAMTLASALTAPEAAIWALMIAGFGVIGAAMRHQRQRITTRYA
jgi:hypothetical protein